MPKQQVRLYWDDVTNPLNPGYVLRYHRDGADHEDQVDGRTLDEAMLEAESLVGAPVKVWVHCGRNAWQGEVDACKL